MFLEWVVLSQRHFKYITIFQFSHLRSRRRVSHTEWAIHSHTEFEAAFIQNHSPILPRHIALLWILALIGGLWVAVRQVTLVLLGQGFILWCHRGLTSLHSENCKRSQDLIYFQVWSILLCQSMCKCLSLQTLSFGEVFSNVSQRYFPGHHLHACPVRPPYSHRYLHPWKEEHSLQCCFLNSSL